MSLIGGTYFDKVPVIIPIGSTDNRQQYIDYYEPKVIRDLFGYSLGSEILAYTAGSDQRIKDIVEGKEYQLNGKTEKWHGLKDETTKISLIAFFVYYWWQRKNVTKTTTNGEVLLVNENSVKVTPAVKVQDAWNKYEEQVISLNAFISVNSGVYPEFESTDLSESVNAFDL